MRKRILSLLSGILLAFILTGCAWFGHSAPATAPATAAVISDSALKAWGLGWDQYAHVSLNRNYEWYVDQMNTGPASNNNCGPACVVMAAAWSDGGHFEKTTEDIRNWKYNNGGWWYIADIQNALQWNGIPVKRQQGVATDDITDDIDDGMIVILNIHTRDITFDPNVRHHVGKPYQAEFGHFIIMKGYLEADGLTYFEVYDPWSMGMKYDDGTLVGKDRYYLSDEVVHSAQEWCDSMIAVKEK